MDISEKEIDEKNFDIESYKIYFEHLSNNENIIKKKNII